MLDTPSLSPSKISGGLFSRKKPVMRNKILGEIYSYSTSENYDQIVPKGGWGWGSFSSYVNTVNLKIFPKHRHLKS